MLVPSNLTTLDTFIGKPGRKRPLGRPERKRDETEMREDMDRILVPRIVNWFILLTRGRTFGFHNRQHFRRVRKIAKSDC